MRKNAKKIKACVKDVHKLAGKYKARKGTLEYEIEQIYNRTKK